MTGRSVPRAGNRPARSESGWPLLAGLAASLADGVAWYGLSLATGLMAVGITVATWWIRQ